MMVIGGAVVPEIQGLLADAFDYRKSFLICVDLLSVFDLFRAVGAS